MYNNWPGILFYRHFDTGNDYRKQMFGTIFMEPNHISEGNLNNFQII